MKNPANGNDMELDRNATNYTQLHASFRWQAPAQYNIAHECRGRWADDRGRFALYYEDESGLSSAPLPRGSPQDARPWRLTPD